MRGRAVSTRMSVAPVSPSPWAVSTSWPRAARSSASSEGRFLSSLGADMDGLEGGVRAQISASLAPSARESRITATGTRVPSAQSWPPQMETAGGEMSGSVHGCSRLARPVGSMRAPVRHGLRARVAELQPSLVPGCRPEKAPSAAGSSAQCRPYPRARGSAGRSCAGGTNPNVSGGAQRRPLHAVVRRRVHPFQRTALLQNDDFFQGVGDRERPP